MKTIGKANAHTVRRYMTVFDRSKNDYVPLEAAVLKARLALTPNGVPTAEIPGNGTDTFLTVTEITMTMGFPGYYDGMFDQTELDLALDPLDGQDVYEVVRTGDGSYIDNARLRVANVRFVAQL